MEILKMVNSSVRFLLELSLLAAVAYWGFSEHATGLSKALLGVGLPLLIALLWGLFVAPKARYPLPGTVHLMVEMSLLAIGAIALFLSQKPTLGWIYSILIILNKVLLVIWKQ